MTDVTVTTEPDPAAGRPDKGPRRREFPAHSDKPFQLAVLLGGDAGFGEAIADSSVTLENVGTSGPVESVGRTSLSPSDLRSKTIFIVDAPVAEAVSTYVVLCGLANRFLDVATPDGVVLASRHHDGRNLEDLGKAPERADLVQLTTDATDVPSADEVLGIEGALSHCFTFENRHLDHLTPEQVSEIRSARRVMLQVPERLEDAFFLLLYVAGVRSRRDFERLPLMWADGKVVDLDDLRRQGAGLRKTHRTVPGSVVAPVEPTDRQQRLHAAGQIDVSAVLTALGSQASGDAWQCPRPWSHTHGDATPSMQTQDNKVRCYVDDAEWIDPLRLVVETCRVTPDEAASLLLGPLTLFEPFKERIVAERTRRASA